MTANDVKTELEKYASDSDAINLSWFFKTGEGEYSEGDQFIGVRMPIIRKVCREFTLLPISEVAALIESPIHEHRMSGLIILMRQYKTNQKAVYDLYLHQLDKGTINNWDLVDVTCRDIIGEYARTHSTDILFQLAKKGLWHKRTAMVSCFAWLRRGEVGPTLELAGILWPERHDLLQKAVGWMLREMGKRVDEQLLLNFLDTHAHEMPRTELRYAIERLDTATRTRYMQQRKED